MVRKSASLIACAVLGASALGACAPVIRTQGYVPLDANPSQAVVGTDNQVSVRTKYGTPTAVAALDPNTWYYMNQTTAQFGAYRPQVRTRTIVEIKFDPQTNRVVSVRGLDATDGQQIAYSRRETPTVGRQLGIIEQILGTVGGQVLPPQDDDPGNLPGSRR